jgi:metal-responsive CopG/Arc/MetJ family transcriptional regulator
MHRTNIYLDERQCEALDRLAAEEGTSRAELIRRVLDRWLAGDDHDVQRDLDAIEASFGVLADLDVPERAPDDRAAHLDRMWRLGA